VNKFLKVHKKSDPKVLFKEMDLDGKNTIDVREFVNFFERVKSQQTGPESEMDKKINEKSLTTLFKALDADGSKSLDLKEFC
jgi:Ca2+-binding EF-hand superfamily protein